MRLFSRPAALLPVLLLSAMLAGCASSGGGLGSSSEAAKTEEAPAEAAAAPASAAAAKPEPATRGRTAPAARAAAAASAPKPDAAAEKVEEPLDQAQASGMCWMQVDKKTNLSLEQKAKFVDKCVDDTLAADRVKWSGKQR